MTIMICAAVLAKALPQTPLDQIPQRLLATPIGRPTNLGNEYFSVSVKGLLRDGSIGLEYITTGVGTSKLYAYKNNLFYPIDDSACPGQILGFGTTKARYQGEMLVLESKLGPGKFAPFGLKNGYWSQITPPDILNCRNLEGLTDGNMCLTLCNDSGATIQVLYIDKFGKRFDLTKKFGKTARGMGPTSDGRATIYLSNSAELLFWDPHTDVIEKTKVPISSWGFGGFGQGAEAFFAAFATKDHTVWHYWNQTWTELHGPNSGPVALFATSPTGLYGGYEYVGNTQSPFVGYGEKTISIADRLIKGSSLVDQVLSIISPELMIGRVKDQIVIIRKAD